MIIALITAILVCAFLLYFGYGYLAWVLGLGVLMVILKAGPGFFLLYGCLALIFGVPAIRRQLLSRLIMRIMAGVLPRLGKTERVALEAGTVWWDGELFSGRPNWKKLLGFKFAPLSEKEKVFLAGPVEELCVMLNDWEITQQQDLSSEIWEFLRKNKFFGMIIPETFGGLGFSALAHSAVITKLSSRSLTAAVTVMVPNSLGPAELLLHYGTEAQKKHYLPRLARGEEIPCFALTGPEAGSDAAATQSVGIVCKGIYDGKEILGIRLNWRKRYITLGPISTVIGLAFRLQDPDLLLGAEKDRGITCALIPSHLPGISIGERHDPLGVPFQNGPNTGHDVFVPVDFIIGGPQMAGEGWRMLMQSLAAGRSISLPSLSVGAAELATRIVGAYATVREQFDTPIGRFEGIEEALARMGGLTYLMNATRLMTVGAVDLGEKPAVVSAIAKAYLTELMRVVVNDAMDIRAGSGICRGPRNHLEHLYRALPIGITVEGANILTRSMIIYGQGAIRCHPFVGKEMRAIETHHLKDFDFAFFKHTNFIFVNAARAFLLGMTGSLLHRPPVPKALRGYFRKLARMSAAFALVSDVAMATLGGQLKRREKISGRLADMLAWMYLGSASLKRFLDQGQEQVDLPFVRWACEYSLFQVQNALHGILDNLPNRFAALLLRPIVLPLGIRWRLPNDKLGSLVARGLLEDRQARLNLTSDIFVPRPNELGLGRLEAALDKAVAALAIETKIRDALRAHRLDKAPGEALVEDALRIEVITAEEAQLLHIADQAREEAIQVDSFDPQKFKRMHG